MFWRRNVVHAYITCMHLGAAKNRKRAPQNWPWLWQLWSLSESSCDHSHPGSARFCPQMHYLSKSIRRCMHIENTITTTKRQGIWWYVTSHETKINRSFSETLSYSVTRKKKLSGAPLKCRTIAAGNCTSMHLSCSVKAWIAAPRATVLFAGIRLCVAAKLIHSVLIEAHLIDSSILARNHPVIDQVRRSVVRMIPAIPTEAHTVSKFPYAYYKVFSSNGLWFLNGKNNGHGCFVMARVQQEHRLFVYGLFNLMVIFWGGYWRNCHK